MNKKIVLEKAIEYYQSKINQVEARVKKTNKSASDAPGSMESWSDKSKDEFTQLAAALSKEISPLNKSLEKMNEILVLNIVFDKIAIGSLICVQFPNRKDNLLIVPSGGGESIKIKDASVFLLSKDSELANVLIGCKTGDEISWRDASVTILEVE